MSPKVATEVGNKMGVVEDVERRQCTNDQSFFLRVRVALPIAKPIQRASKAAATVEYQYGDWLKVDNGRSKSPPRRSKENLMRFEPVGRTDTLATASDEGIEEVTALARASDYRASQNPRNGNCVVGGSGPEIQEKISEVNAAHNSNVNGLLPIFSPSGDVH
nr:hypothetical protein CFP56_25082 [Quercus suber]